MKYFETDKIGRVILVHMTEGDDLLIELRMALKEAGVTTGIIASGIGSLRKLHYHYIAATTEKPQDIFEVIEKPMELVSLQGIVLEGEPHLHLQASEGGSKSMGGHLEEGTEVQYLVEISVVELPEMPLARRAGNYGTVTHFEWV